MFTSSCAYTVLAGSWSCLKLSVWEMLHILVLSGHILAPWVARSCFETIFIAPCFPRKENPDYTMFFQGPNLDYQNTRTRVRMIEGIYHTGEICVIMYPLEKSLWNRLSYRQTRYGWQVSSCYLNSWVFSQITKLIFRNTGYSKPLLKMRGIFL